MQGLLLFRFTTHRLCVSSPLLVELWRGRLPCSFIVCKWVCVSLYFRSFLLRTRTNSIRETLTINFFFTLRSRSPRGHVGLTFHNPSVKWWLVDLSLFLNQNYNLGRLKINSIPNATQWAKVQIIYLYFRSNKLRKSVKFVLLFCGKIYFITKFYHAVKLKKNLIVKTSYGVKRGRFIQLFYARTCAKKACTRKKM